MNCNNCSKCVNIAPLKFCGIYNKDCEYDCGDIVKHNDKTYIALKYIPYDYPPEENIDYSNQHNIMWLEI